MDIRASLFNFGNKFYNKDKKSNKKTDDVSFSNNITEEAYVSHDKALASMGMAQISFGSQKIDIPISDLEEQIKEGKSSAEIAKVFGVSAPYICKVLKKYGLKTKPQLEQELQEERVSKITVEELQKLIEEGKNTYEIADIYGITSITVGNKLKSLGLQTKDQVLSRAKLAIVAGITKEQLQQFISEGKSAEEISKILNVSRRTILNKFAEFGLKSQTQVKNEILKNKIKEITPEKLQQYINDGKSTYELAEIFGVSRQVISRLLLRLALHTVKQIENTKSSNDQTTIPRSELRRLIAEKKNISEIAQIYGTSRLKIRNLLREYGLQTETQVVSKRRSEALAAITVDDFQQLIDKGKTLAEIAQIYNVNEGTIASRLKEYGLKTFEQVFRKAQRLKNSAITKENMEALLNAGKSSNEIAKMYGLSVPTIFKKILEFKLKTKEQIQREIVLNIKENDLRILCKEKNAGEIALILNVSRQTVFNKLKEYGLKTKEQFQREYISLITANDILEEIAQGKSPKSICNSLGIKLYTYRSLLKKFGIKIPRSDVKIPSNNKYKETKKHRYEAFSFEDIQNRLIELSECEQIIQDENLENLITFICDRKNVGNLEKADIINFTRMLDRINLGLLNTAAVNNSDETKVVISWMQNLIDINDNFNIALGNLYQSDEEEVANICIENYSPNIDTNENIKEAQYIIDILKNATTQEDITNAKYKIIYLHTNKVNKDLAKKAERYSRDTLGKLDFKTIGQYIYYHDKYNQYLNGNDISTPITQDFLRIFKDNEISPEIALPYFIKLDNLFSSDLIVDSSLDEFMSRFNTNSNIDKEIINVFARNFYIKNPTKITATSKLTGNNATVILAPEAKQAIYDAYPSEYMQIICKFENALTKLDVSKKESGIKKYVSVPGASECRIDNSPARLFALNDTLIFTEFDSSHKQKIQHQKLY